MNLHRQKLLIDHFHKFLEKEISLAKKGGNFDQGIMTVSGQSVVINKPRSFCFRGLEAKDERLLVYKVVVDRGMNSQSARSLYEEALTDDAVNNNSNTSSNHQRIVTGFYADKRNFFKEVPRIFLIIDQESTSSNCIVVRPNEGKKLVTKNWLWNVYLATGSMFSIIWTSVKNEPFCRHLKLYWEVFNLFFIFRLAVT
jgi:hypothetical protein